jgi:hypothetical protein
VFKSVINTAVLDGLLGVNPCYRIEQPEPHPHRFDPLTAAQVAANAWRAPVRYRAFGESAGLGRSHVLVELRLLAVDRQLDRHNSRPSPARTSSWPRWPAVTQCGGFGWLLWGGMGEVG